jgi:hypothetical protein
LKDGQKDLARQFAEKGPRHAHFKQFKKLARTVGFGGSFPCIYGD